MQILDTLRQNDESNNTRFGISQLDDMLQCIEDVRSSTNRHSPTPPIIELQCLYPGGGKTQLLYHLAAIAVLPASVGGKQAAVAIIDTDGRFSVSRLAHQIKQQAILSLDNNTANADVEEIMLVALKHVHIFTPQSLPSTIATVKSLSAYLFDPTRHHSFDRTINFIAVDSASVFYWQHRTDADDATLLNSTSNSSRPATQPSGYVQLAAALKNSVRIFNTPIIFSSWHLGAVKDANSNSGPEALSFRSSLPAPWPNLPTLRLMVHRAPVRKLPVEISVEDALRESEARQKVVEKGKVECFVNESGVEGRMLQKLRARGAGFDFYITADGVNLRPVAYQLSAMEK